ncbi:MAG: DUF4012 domain-containing protein [bacterium]
MEDKFEFEPIIEKHGPTTSLFASKDGLSPANKEVKVKVRVANLAPLSPYIVRVSNPVPVAQKKPESFIGARMNLLTSYLLMRDKFVQSEGSLDFTEADFKELLDEDDQSSNVFEPRRHPFKLRAVIIFSFLAFLVVLPMRAFSTRDEIIETKNQIISASQAGIAALKNAKGKIETQDVGGAVTDFMQAEKSFNKAENLSNFNSAVMTLAKMVPEGRAVDAGNKSLFAISKLSLAAADLTKSFGELKNDKVLTSKITRLEMALRGIKPTLEEVNSTLADVNPNDLPVDFPIDSAKTTLSAITAQISPLAQALSLASEMLGATAPKRYLLLFQNSEELRPTGGFIGSFALLDVKQGAITNLEIPGDGSYNLQGRQTKRVLAPEPLRVLSPQWQFQDSNWFFDFRDSARKAAEFYARAGGPSVDGVISINSRLMEDLLAITGPMEIPGTKEIVDSENFTETAQRLAQFDYDKAENKPKAFIAKLAPEILKNITNGDSDKFMALSKLFSTSLHDKELQVWSANEETATVLHDFGWDGAVLDYDYDYLALVNTNIAGGKTDGVITETITDTTTINEDGRITKNVEVRRTHNGVKGNKLTGDTNTTYHRLYVPKGSKLISVVGSVPTPIHKFGSDETLGDDEDLMTPSEKYDFFDAWSELKPGKSITLRFAYELPPQPNGRLAAFSTIYDVQSGTSRTVNHTITYPPSWKLLWHDDNLKASDKTLSFERPFEHSFSSSVLFER